MTLGHLVRMGAQAAGVKVRGRLSRARAIKQSRGRPPSQRGLPIYAPQNIVAKLNCELHRSSAQMEGIKLARSRRNRARLENKSRWEVPWCMLR